MCGIIGYVGEREAQGILFNGLKHLGWGQRGFTLLELLIVITILAILAGAMVPLFKSSNLDAQIAKAKEDLEVIRDAAYLLYDDTGYWPPAVNCGCGLVRDPNGDAGSNIPGWDGPYLSARSVPTAGSSGGRDPWGYNYELYDNGTALLARSCGPDGKRLTGDDIILTITPDRTTGLYNGYLLNFYVGGPECSTVSE